jgi:hypothetical protein
MDHLSLEGLKDFLGSCELHSSLKGGIKGVLGYPHIELSGLSLELFILGPETKLVRLQHKRDTSALSRLQGNSLEILKLFHWPSVAAHKITNEQHYCFITLHCPFVLDSS